MTTKAELATGALAVGAPEIAIPLQLLQGLRQKKAPSEMATHPGEVVVVPAPEHPPFIILKKQRVRVLTRKGIRIVVVEPAKGLSIPEVLGIVVVGGIAYAAYSLGKSGGAIGNWNQLQKNALGIPFHTFLPGGGSNPLNYILP